MRIYEEKGDPFEAAKKRPYQVDDFSSSISTCCQQAFFTREALQRIAEVAVGNLTAFASGDEAQFQRVV